MIKEALNVEYLDVPDKCPNNKCYIYVLLDPFTHAVRYVGRTINCLSNRLYSHCSVNGVRSTITYRNTNWVRSILQKGNRPIIKVVAVVDIEEWGEYEKQYIKYFKELGANLTNFSEGGLGNTRSNAKKWTIDQKENKRKKLAKRKRDKFVILPNGEIILSNVSIIDLEEYFKMPYKRVYNSFLKGNLIEKKYFVVKDPASIPKNNHFFKYKIYSIDNNIILDSLTEVAKHLSIPLSTLSISLKKSNFVNNYIIEKYYD